MFWFILLLVICWILLGRKPTIFLLLLGLLFHSQQDHKRKY